MNATQHTEQQWPISQLIHGVRNGQALLWRATLVYALGLLVCALLMVIDHRMLNGVNVWDKPAKFFLSLMVQFATLSWALSFLPAGQRNKRSEAWLVGATITAATVEMVYMCYRAARGEASHFNGSTVFAQVMYAVMGVGALTLTATAFAIGFRVWRARGKSLMMEAAGLGLMIGMIFGTLAGGFMSARTGHWVGGELSDAHGLGFFSWSTTGGDLRVAHFIGLHLTQALPLAALSKKRWVVFATAIIGVLLTAITFAMAISGVPLLRG
jgi:hypothetical protein